MQVSSRLLFSTQYFQPDYPPHMPAVSLMIHSVRAFLTPLLSYLVCDVCTEYNATQRIMRLQPSTRCYQSLTLTGEQLDDSNGVQIPRTFLNVLPCIQPHHSWFPTKFGEICRDRKPRRETTRVILFGLFCED